MTDFSLLDCEHKNTHFISSSRATGDNYTEHSLIRVCKDCGLIMIRATVNGQSWSRDFHIHSHAVLDSMRIWADSVEKNENPV